MSRNNRTKKNKRPTVTIDEAIKIANKATYKMAKEVMERFYLTLASQLSSPPYRWNEEKILRLKSKLDRSMVGLFDGIFDKQLYVENLEEKGIDINRILKVDVDDVESYLKGE